MPRQTSHFEISNGFADDFSSLIQLLPRPTWPWLTGQTQPQMTRPLRSTPITGASSLLRAGPPARPATVLTPLDTRLLPVAAKLIHRTDSPAVSRRAFPRSLQEPQTRLMPPQCRTPPGQKPGTRQALLPQPATWPRFRCHSDCDDTSTAVRGHSSSWSPPDTSRAPFPHRSPRRRVAGGSLTRRPSQIRT